SSRRRHTRSYGDWSSDVCSSDLGYRVLEAGTGKDALSILAQAKRIDLLLTDIVMPGMNGPELVEAARKNRRNLIALFMSGYDRRSEGRRVGKECGARGVLGECKG